MSGSGVPKKYALSAAHEQAYWSWLNMRIRCRYPSSNSYKYYGGKGITVYQPWDDSFLQFIKDAGLPLPGQTIDRWPNKEGNYEPGNVRWASDAEQARNRSSNNNITLNGVTRCIKDWSTHLGGSEGLIKERLRDGWSIKKACTSPARPYRKQ